MGSRGGGGGGASTVTKTSAVTVATDCAVTMTEKKTTIRNPARAGAFLIMFHLPV
jgi:hypothetical protein